MAGTGCCGRAAIPHAAHQIGYGFVGEVIDVRTGPILDAVHAETVPVISPLARTDDGVVLNINADIAAATKFIAAVWNL